MRAPKMKTTKLINNSSAADGIRQIGLPAHQQQRALASLALASTLISPFCSTTKRKKTVTPAAAIKPVF